MLAASRRLQNVCPNCTAQILRFYERSIAELSITALPPSRRATPRNGFRHRRNDARFLSTTPRRAQEKSTEDVQPETHDVPPPPEPEDIETLVRQTKDMFGDTLPKGYLSEKEYKLYEMLYGAPLRVTTPEDVGIGSMLGEEVEDEEPEAHDPSRKVLLRQTKDGQFEEVEYHVESTTTKNEDGETVATEEEIVVLRPPTNAQIEYIEVNAKNEREYSALLQLQQDFETARIKAKEEAAKRIDEEVEEDEDQEEEEEEEDEEEEDYENAELDKQRETMLMNWPGLDAPRFHPYSSEGKFRTSPSTVHLPKEELLEPITELLRRTDTKHIRAAAESAFGGKTLPFSCATPQSKLSLPQKPIQMEAGHHKMSPIDADAYMATVMPGVYASVSSTLVEVRKRLGPDWLRGLLNRKDGQTEGPRILDAGAAGAGLAAWNSVIQAEWDTLLEKKEATDLFPPAGKKTVLVGSDMLRHRISRFLDNTQFIPRLPNYTHSVENAEKLLDGSEKPHNKKTYDVIIASHLLMPLDKEWRRREMLDNLWHMLSPEGGVLIVLEKGHPRGFEAVAEVRDRLISEFIIPPTPGQAPDSIEPEADRVREPGMIVAPCTNHTKCPMYLTPGLSPGRKDFCHFSQRFIRPPFLQRVLENVNRNHEDIQFSFISVRRGMPPAAEVPEGTEAEKNDTHDIKTIRQGEEATTQAFAGYEDIASDHPDRPHALSLPRNILPPLKRKGHVTLDLCTPAGQIERWTIPRSFSKQAYHDARKARWGDLWALGAKTRVHRKVRLGRGVEPGVGVPQDGGIRAQAALDGARRGKAKVVELSLGERGIFGASAGNKGKTRPERRTKGGRRRPQLKDFMNKPEVEDDD